jgi:energy-coupling factor transporter ATPase
VIEVDGVSFSYRTGEPDEVIALADVQFAISPTDFVALIGRNGSGKSTLARMLMAFLFPTSGQVRVDGITSTWENRWAIRERVAIVFQDPDDQLVASRTVDDVAFGPENLGVPAPELERRVEEALDAVGMLPRREALIAELSTGEKQLVAIAGALAMHPRFLILDEPTTFLSPPQAQRLLDTVHTIHRSRAMGVIHITHQMGEAVSASQVMVLDQGRVALAGSPEQVFAQPDVLRAIGLDVPLPVDLSQRLRASGFALPGTPLTPLELAEGVRHLVAEHGAVT